MRRRAAPCSARPAALALGLLAACTPAPVQPPPLGSYLWVVELARARGDIDLSNPLRFAAYTSRPEAVGRKLAPMSTSVARDHVVLEARGYPILPPVDPSAFLAATFVVDFDQPAVGALAVELRDRYGDIPSPDQIVDLVRSTIRPISERGFDVASQVAAHRTGDCTEHAVLFTALARSVGIPARIVSGILILRIGDELGAFGHAWSETHDGAQWRPIDPTEFVVGEPLVYLPEGILDDEGPGYALGLARIYRHGIERIVVLPNRPPRAGPTSGDGVEWPTASNRTTGT